MALETEKHIMELADRLTQSANVIHDRLMKAIRAKQVDQAMAQLIFQDEVVLSQRTNALYIDAVNCVVAGLQPTQKGLLGMVDTANDRIHRIKAITQRLDLTADLLVLAAAAYAAKPGPILAALQEVKQDIDEIGEKCSIAQGVLAKLAPRGARQSRARSRTPGGACCYPRPSPAKIAFLSALQLYSRAPSHNSVKNLNFRRSSPRQNSLLQP